MRKQQWKNSFLMSGALVLLALLLAACGAIAPMNAADSGKGAYKQEAAYAEALKPNPPVEEDEAAQPAAGMTDVESEPVSTISADVDTASYTLFRSAVRSDYSLQELRENGYTFRAEEMLNYFRYAGAKPREGELFGVKMEMAVCPWNARKMLLNLNFATEPVEISAKNNLVFLIDVSGSMGAQDKLPLLKESFRYLTDQLDGDDTVSIVTYSGKYDVVLEGCPGKQKDRILKAIQGLKANGSTNGGDAMLKAYEIAGKYFAEDGNNRIIMASDGDLNVGITSTDEIRRLVETKAREQQIYLSVLGFGYGSYRDDMMETIADYGNGVYYYIDCLQEAEKVLGSEIMGTLYTIAQNVKLQLTFVPELVKAYRLIGYDNRVLQEEDFLDDAKDAGDIGCGHTFTVCYELLLEEGALQAETPLLHVAVRYNHLAESSMQTDEYPVYADVFTGTPSAYFRFSAAVLETAMLLNSSPYLYDGEGAVTLRNVVQSLQTLELTDADEQEFYSLVARLAENSVEDDPTVREHYYGSFSGWDVYMTPTMLCVISRIDIAGYEFRFSSSFTLHAEKDGQSLPLEKAYAEGVLTEKDIAAIYEAHQTEVQRMGLGFLYED